MQAGGQASRSKGLAHLALLAVLAAGLAVYAWMAAAAAPFSRGALVAVLVPGAVLGQSPGAGRRSGSRRRTSWT
jgi:hypothetical protein